ncbi:MAG: hypothetical protein PHC64_00695 [Candidatus Gastranaerophilales bacterium]|nr:hypothetical protein [Candidatus Gastranaerophilales bacterium]
MKKIITFMFIFICLSSGAKAQQTIINVPSSEVLPAGDIILKDSNRMRPFAPGQYASITPSVTLGTGFGTEITAGVGTSIDDNHNTNAEFDLSAKKVWFLGSATRFTVGGTLSPSFTQSVHPDSFLFSHFSHRIKKTKTSLTAGTYFGGIKGLPDNFGVLLGIEQVIIPNKLRIAVDWLSSRDSYGRMGVGIKYRPVPTVSITSAVIIPNDDSDNIAFNISISKFISLDNENPIKRRLTNVD